MLRFVRVVMPVVLMVAGIVVIAVGGASEESLEVGIPVFSAGASIWFVNFLWRVGVSGDKDRDVEEDARDYFAKHGHWPDETPGGEAGR
ncbi:MAG: hypothetical protein J7513_00760 [Solirubrobacteraceae bacterium]|nr:hypothetical protein [Solirubrobacteraceae bacterium]